MMKRPADDTNITGDDGNQSKMTSASTSDHLLATNANKETTSVCRCESAAFQAIISRPELAYLFALFRRHKKTLRIAGGAVRDLLMSIEPHDIDFATTATPDQMRLIFDAERVRMINTNGEKHGTITVRLDDKENYEITTLRIDVVTDGRHAEVQFTDDWRLDANRRDLTINSIFLDEDGTIVDFFQGYRDLQLRRVCFVGDPVTRIREDYLRILRYFRFYGRICTEADEHTPATLDAIRHNADGLAKIAGERLWVEFCKIVRGRHADTLLRRIVDTGVHRHLGLPEKLDVAELERVYALYKNNLSEMPAAITMTCALLHSTAEFEQLQRRMKFSNDERKLAEFVLAHRAAALQPEPAAADMEVRLRPYRLLLVDNAREPRAAIERLVELLKYAGRAGYAQALREWKVPVFPVTGDMLMQLSGERRVAKGPEFARVLHRLRELWKHKYELDTSEATVRELLDAV